MSQSIHTQPGRTPFGWEFSSEDLLREAIAGLLRRLDNVRDVHITHGTSERGKDIVFYMEGFGERIPCACVVKNSPLSGSVSDSHGMRNVYFQVEQAFDTELMDEEGNSVRIQRVYVVTPYELPLSTINSISGRVKADAGRIQFIHGSTLFQLFRDYWPDYLAAEAGLIREYLERAAKELEHDRDCPALHAATVCRKPSIH